jgi:hypothetical protein
MTQYNNKVLEHIEKMEAEEWGKGIKYVLADNGRVEYVFNNGEKHIEDTKTGEKWIEGKELDTESLLDKFSRFITDRRGRDPFGE